MTRAGRRHLVGVWSDYSDRLKRQRNGRTVRCARTLLWTWIIDGFGDSVVGACHGVMPVAVVDSGEHGGKVNGFPLVFACDWCPSWTTEPAKIGGETL